MIRVLLILAFATLSTSSALAIGELKKEWGVKYAGDDTGAFQSIVKKASCYVCHVKGVKDKKTAESRNEYGKSMSAFLKSKGVSIDKLKEEYKKGDKEAAIKKMIYMFEQVGKEKSQDGDTFEAKIKDGKLPATDANL